MKPVFKFGTLKWWYGAMWKNVLFSSSKCEKRKSDET